MKKCFSTSKHFILRILLCILVFRSDFVFGQSHKPSINNLSPMYRILLKSLEAMEDKKMSNFIHFVPKSEKISGLFLIKDGIDEEILKKNGVTIGTKAGKVWTYSVPRSKFADFVTTPNIKYIDIDRPVRPMMDSLKKAIHLDSISLNPNIPKPLCGENVIIGIIDQGFDYTHPMYFDTEGDKNRIMWVWELNSKGVPPPGYTSGSFITDYNEMIKKGWDYPTLSPEDTLKQGYSFSHGTFVSGIATGSGAPYTKSSKYSRIAPCADIALVALDFVSNEASESQIIDAVNLIFQTAEFQNKPAVINCSFGRVLGSHDGNSLYSQAIDALTGPGKIVVHAAGNNGNRNLHKSKTFTAQDSVMNSIIFVQKSLGNDSIDLGSYLDFWGEKSMDFSIQVSMLKSNKIVDSTEYIHLDDEIHNKVLTYNQDSVSLLIVTSKGEQLNDKPAILMDASSNYVGNLLIKIKSKNGVIHAWNYSDIFRSNPIYKATAGDAAISITDQSTTKSVISAGSFNTKLTFSNINNVLLTNDYNLKVLGGLSYFSSLGPDVEGNVLPTITAPGAIVVSSASSFDPDYANISRNTLVVDRVKDRNSERYYSYSPVNGTSFAAPTVTGTIALLLQLDPTLTPAQIKEILKKSAIHDQFTGSIPPEGKNDWGYGKLNAYQAIIELIKLSGTHDSTIKSSEKDLILYPNPTDDYTFLFIDNIQASDIPAIKVFNAGGQLMPTDHLNTESNNLIRLISKAGSQESTLYMLVCITQTRC